MILQGRFFVPLTDSGILCKWQGEAKEVAEEDPKDNYWDIEVDIIDCTLIGFGLYIPKKMQKSDTDSDVWALLIDRADIAIRKELAFRRMNTAYPAITWPDEVNF